MPLAQLRSAPLLAPLGRRRRAGQGVHQQHPLERTGRLVVRLACVRQIKLVCRGSACRRVAQRCGIGRHDLQALLEHGDVLRQRSVHRRRDQLAAGPAQRQPVGLGAGLYLLRHRASALLLPDLFDPTVKGSLGLRGLAAGVGLTTKVGAGSAASGLAPTRPVSCPRQLLARRRRCPDGAASGPPAAASAGRR